MNNAPEIAVSVRELEKRFGDFTAVNKVTFDVRQGEIFGFLGPNGAGKSTTIRMLCGIYAPTSGSGTVGGFDIIREQNLIKEHIGYMSQKFSLYDDLTVEENIDFYSGIYKIPAQERQARKEEVIRLANLEDFRHRPTKIISGGWKQRLALGCALIHHPQMLFLDEPTSGVDPITRANFWAIIKDLAGKGVTIFVTTHYMDEAENCNRMVLIYHGTIIAMGTPEEMKTKFMKSDVVEIVLAEAQNWIDDLGRLDVIKEAALFGSNIHAVVYEAEKAIPAITAYLSGRGAEVGEIRKIMPSLEDVFVSAIENYDKAHEKS
ncbi:MAG: ABC transporter ATP-binding protein [Candidatus Omnitrophica bacterium]|nr:ABC transporter ATP-binding protein [Candidatus Omnitrophota bacterium]MDD5573714.1 ABC transporter ATP-binding protein [Candidatus Omnitrophota bacterium]